MSDRRGPHRAVIITAIVSLLAWGCTRAEPPEPPPATAPATPPAATAPAAPPAKAPPATPPPATAPPATPPSATAPPPGPTAAEHAEMHAADGLCADCHPLVADAWAASPMARSLRPRAAAPEAPFTHPAEISDPATGQIYRQQGGRFEVQAGARTMARTPSHVLGSGRHNHTLLWRAEDRLFQLPLSWYTARGAWALSPGYAARAAGLDLFREVGTGCLNCHADPVVSQPGSELRPVGDLHPMGCVRCHGDGRAHAEGQLAGRATPIVRPDRLPPDRARDICATCHFGGAVRVLRPGRRWADFLPGGRLADTVALFARSRARAGFGSADQAGRLALSACARATPSMTCTTCHQPHPTDAARAADRSAACRDCHRGSDAAPAHACADPQGAGAEADCAGCHMDEGPTHNIPHTSGIDHYIRVRPEPGAPVNNDSPLVWVADPQPEPAEPDHQILLGRAYLDAWRADRLASDAQRAEQWLTRGLTRLPQRADGWIALAALRRLRGQVPAAREAAEKAYALEPDDRRHATLVGWARLHTGDPAGAIAAIERARALADSAELAALQAVALRQLGRDAEALTAARRAVELQPSAVDGHLLLGELAAGGGALDPAAEHFRSATDWAPGDVRGWLQLGHLESRRGNWAESAAAYRGAERHAGADARAVDIARQGQDEARRRLGGAPP